MARMSIQAIDALTSSIAAAVEQQSAATNEITRNVQNAANGVDAITGDVAQLEAASRRTGEASGQFDASAAEIADRSTALKKNVESFLRRLGEVQAA